MAIKFFKYKRKVNINGVTVDKYHPILHLGVEVGFEELAEMVSNKSTMSRGDILGVLAEIETAAWYMLENGHTVKLGLFGSFMPAIETKSVDSPEDVTSRLIKRFKLIFKPSKYLKSRYKNVEFVLGDNIVRDTKYKKE